MGRISSMVAKTKGLFGREMDAYKKETGFIFELKKEFTILLKDPKACVKELKSIKYKTGSLFLKECFEYLVSSPNEVMHLVSGTELGSETYSLDRMLKIEFQASIAGATADMRGLLQKLVEIDESYGHMLLGVFHSHPSKGIGGTCPSGIDRNLQDNLEKSDYSAIQAVFSRDGFIRFFSNNLPFEIEVYGKGIERREEHDKEKIFQLTEIEI